MDSQTLLTQMQQINLWPEEPSAQAEMLRLQQQLPEARALAKELLARNLLTPFQINQLLTGKGQSLVVGPYRLDERLGEGAHAQVFKAHHFRHQRVVALKVIRPERIHANPVAIERFFREAQAAAALSHPNVVRAYDVGQENGVYFFALQFLNGVDLAKLVAKEGRLEVNRACDFLLQAARGLQHIHESGMVHRDLKPSNLMVVSGKDAIPATHHLPLTTHQIKILDLGLARLDEDPSTPNQRAALTKLGTVMGTPDYMAPEQAEDSRKADIRSDIYSLGCTLYFALTGRPPFPGGDAIEKMLKHMLDPPTPIEELRPEVPDPVGAILHKMMAKKKEDRWQTPQELVLALQAFLEPPARAIPIGGTTPVAVPAVPTFSADPAAEANLPVLVSSPLVRLPSRRSDWGLWVFLACACAAAIVCLIVAMRIVLR